MQSEMTRPIVGIENRTAKEVFDIMCDRFKIALSAAEPWPFERQNYNCPCIHPSQCDESCVKKPAPSVAVRALADAYKAGFEASSQGYNGEIFPDYESDSEWLAQRDSDLSALSAQVQDVAGCLPEEVHEAATEVITAHECGMLRQTIWWETAAFLLAEYTMKAGDYAAAPAKQEG